MGTRSKILAGAALCVLAVASALMLYRLGAEPIQDYDEATYAQVVHEAFANHNFFSFTYAGVPFLKKPPLMFWAMGIFEKVLGENAFAMRLPYVLSGIALILFIMLASSEAGATAWAAIMAGVIATTTSPLIETARQVRMDVPVTLCIVAAFYYFLKALKNPKWFLAFGLCIGLGILTKSVIVAFAIVAALMHLLFSRRFEIAKEKYFWWGIVVASIAALPWHFFELWKFGPAFFQQYIGVEVLQRTQENLFWTVQITNQEYIQYLVQFTLPWVWIFVGAILTVGLRWKTLDHKIRTASFASLATMLCMLAVFFYSATKAPTYLIPLYPFAAIIIALGISALPRLAPAVKIFGVVAACLLVAVGLKLTIYNAYHINPYYSTYLSLARDEEIIGKTIAQSPPEQAVYVFDDQNLGSIQYYSQHLHPIQLTPAAHISPGAYVLTTTVTVEKLKKTFPAVNLTPVYVGPKVSLFAEGM